MQTRLGDPESLAICDSVGSRLRATATPQRVDRLRKPASP